jgi:hypothetical protein
VGFQNQVGVFDVSTGLHLEAASAAGVGVIGTR